MNIDEVQRRLWEQSQAHKQNRESGTPLFPTNRYDGRIGNLMDLMHNPTWIVAACERMLRRSRGKAAGVDGVRVSAQPECAPRGGPMPVYGTDGLHLDHRG